MWPDVSFPVVVVLVAAVAAAVLDLWKFRVYNLLTFPLVASGIVYYGATEGWYGLTTSVLGTLFGLGILLPFCLMGGMGAGDVKLMAGVGAWLGMPITFVVFVVSGLAAGVYAVCLILINGRLHETWFNLRIIWYRLAAIGRFLGAEDQVEIEVNRPDRRRHVIPYGVMVAVGIFALLVLAWVSEKP